VSGVPALLDQALHFLGSSTRRHQQGIRHVNDDKVINTKASDETAGAWDNNSPSDLFRNDWASIKASDKSHGA